MTLYIGVDFHPHQQMISWCDTETGETETFNLQNEVEQVRSFYQALPPAIVGIEASSKAIWFENLLSQSNHQLLVGNPVLIRKRATSRNKSDRRDAELILQLLLKDEFPRLWRRSFENNQVLDMLKLRTSLVRQWTQTYNRLQALAHNFGLPKGKMMAAYIGLDPLENESAGKKKQAPISRAGNSLTRYLLGQSAHIATRYDLELKAFYKRLAKRKPKSVAKTTTARKLLVKLVIMWRDQITAEEFDRRGRTAGDTRTAQGLK